MDVHPLDLSADGAAAAVLDLQRDAYRVEAELIGTEAIPPLHETLGELLRAAVDWLGIRIDGELVAAVAYTTDGATVDIDRLVVAPRFMRRGLGSRLLASLPDARRITVSTGSLNQPAHRFYLEHGFTPVGESEPVPGLRITHYERVTI